MARLDAKERKIALRHVGDVLLQLTIAAGAEDSGNYPLAAGADAYALDALEAVATAFGYRLVPYSAAKLDATLEGMAAA